MQPLKGITVVTLEHAIAAPFATRQLADLGARVIKIERPGSGDFARAYDERVRGLASHFVWTNRSKESLTLDVKHPQAAALLKRLILEQADVVVQNLAPGAAARLGLSFEALVAEKPGIIVCDISGYGDDRSHPGPYRDKKAYDLLVQSEAGFVSVISMLEALGEWMGYPLYYAFDGAPPPPRTGASHATIYPYGPFPAGDGKTVMLGLQNEREWLAFCDKVLMQPALAKDARFASNSKRSAERVALRALIVDTFATLSAAEVLARLDAAQIANAQVNTMAEVWQHPQLAARGRWREVDTAAGPVPALLPPGSWDDGDGPRLDAVPALGQHTDAILRGLGLDAPAIAALRAAEAV